MQDQPTAAELIEAVRHFLQEKVFPQLQDHSAFHARVAANALAIVERELSIAPGANAEEMTRLEALLGQTGTLEELNRELCRRIRNEEIATTAPDFEDHLWKTTLTKLAIDQPKYGTYRRVTSE